MKVIDIVRSVLSKAKKIWIFAVCTVLLTGGTAAFAATGSVTLPFSYHFDQPGTLVEAQSSAESTSPYWWLVSGARLTLVNSIASTVVGSEPATSAAHLAYAQKYPVASDLGDHPQNIFQMFLKGTFLNPSAQIYIKRVKDNLSNSANRAPFKGESLLARYVNDNNFYYGGIRMDGAVVIKKKVGGVYTTLAYQKVLAGTYDATTNYDLIPLNTWIGLKFAVTDTTSGPRLTLYTDVGRTGTWKQTLSVVDDATKFGAPVSSAGLVGILSDFADAQLDEFQLADATGATTTTSVPTATSTPTPTPPPPPPAPTPTPTPPPTTTVSGTYDSAVLADNPVMYLKMNSAASGKELDMTGHSHTGTYKGGTPTSATLPNGESAAVFNGSSQYLSVPTSAALSIPTTHILTWEAWVRPDVANFSQASGDGYVDWMGKCDSYSPTCEWEARLYGASTAEGRPNRFSAYVFNSSAGLGSAADWQPNSTWVPTGKWVHVVAEYQTLTTPTGCNTSSPGSINIWVDGVKQSLADHMPTGCMSQYSIKPTTNSSALNIGTMALDTWFKGAIGKVAVYDHLLSQTQISAHFKAMSGKDPSGSCGSTCTAIMP